jgi:hypothetical protein
MLRAATIIVEMEREPQPVPGRILWPLLERGSVEEDRDLSERWAALLANASMQTTTVLPAFVTILGELSHTEARLLSQFYAITTEIELRKAKQEGGHADQGTGHRQHHFRQHPFH